MKTLTEQIKSIAGPNKNISLEDALRVAARIDSEREETMRLLLLCKTQVGTHIGEDIERALSEMKGQKFSSLAYNYEKMPDGQ